MKKKKIVVIGGSAAGPKTAAKARRLDEHAEIILLQKDKDLSMASCGYDPDPAADLFQDRDRADLLRVHPAQGRAAGSS